MSDGKKHTEKLHDVTDKENIELGAVPTSTTVAKDIVIPEKSELLDAINPYPTGHVCAKLYDVFLKKGTTVACLKMRKNIRVNTEGNIEVGNREYMVLRSAPNGKDIREHNGNTHFLGNSAEIEVAKSGFTLFENLEDITTFIEAFPSGDDSLAGRIGNILRIFGLYKIGPNGGCWSEEDQKRDKEYDGFATLSKVLEDGTFGPYKICINAYIDLDSMKYRGDVLRRHADNGYPAIVSRPISKTK